MILSQYKIDNGTVVVVGLLQGVVIKFKGIWEKLEFMIWEKQGSRWTNYKRTQMEISLGGIYVIHIYHD